MSAGPLKYCSRRRKPAGANDDESKEVPLCVSLCMIVKNEEDVLNRCLESAAELVDEIIIRPLAKIEIVR